MMEEEREEGTVGGKEGGDKEGGRRMEGGKEGERDVGRGKEGRKEGERDGGRHLSDKRHQEVTCIIYSN